jgi:hypothetical protein
MPLSHVVNNCGVGKVEATFRNITTTVGGKRPFTQALVDNFRRACHLAGNDQVSWNATTTNNLFGAVLAVSEDNFAAKNFPARCVVQSAGYVEMAGTTGVANNPLAVSPNRKVSEILGLVALESTTPRSVAYNSRGVIVNVYTTKRATVLF